VISWSILQYSRCIDKRECRRTFAEWESDVKVVASLAETLNVSAIRCLTGKLVCAVQTPVDMVVFNVGSGREDNSLEVQSVHGPKAWHCEVK
jgi:hypothetical protein